jgi:hypothetical protein
MGRVHVVDWMGVFWFLGLTGEKRPVFKEIVFKRLSKNYGIGWKA